MMACYTERERENVARAPNDDGFTRRRMESFGAKPKKEESSCAVCVLSGLWLLVGKKGNFFVAEKLVEKGARERNDGGADV